MILKIGSLSYGYIIHFKYKANFNMINMYYIMKKLYLEARDKYVDCGLNFSTFPRSVQIKNSMGNFYFDAFIILLIYFT